MNALMAPHDKITGYVLAAFIHGSLLLWGNKAFYSPPEYGINAHMGSVEVNLVAAPVAPAEVQTKDIPKEVPKKEEKPKEKEPPKIISKEDMALPNESVKKEATKQKPKPIQFHGDGNSSVPGRDATTFHSIAAIQTVASPDFVANIAPPYPEEAKQHKQEGLVILIARVDASGHPVEVNIKQSSGYFLLDQAALKAVKHWKFKPARMGGIAVESKTEVPVRFRLEQ